jgi:hypothetical protein
MVIGCSVTSNDIGGEYVSPARYQLYNCEQLASESARLHSRATDIAAILDKFALNDPPLNAIGLWPEYARVKGEHSALQQAAIVRKCAMIGPVRVHPPIPGKAITP